MKITIFIVLLIWKIGLIFAAQNNTSNSTGNEFKSNDTNYLTEEDFKNGDKIDIENEVPVGIDLLDEAHAHGHGNYQGDMILTEKQYDQIVNGTTKRALSMETKYWPKTGKVVNIPYMIDYVFDKNERAHIARAIDEYRKKTCIRFVPRSSERDYIHIVRKDGCSSYVGRTGNRQALSLGKGCAWNVGIPIHELMHAIGYLHEQSRSDRDQYVTINLSNVEEGLEHNFRKCPSCDLQDTPYDFDSVMHYGTHAFSKNDKPTIVAKNGGHIGQRNGFSSMDILGINRKYCPHRHVYCVKMTTGKNKSSDGTIQVLVNGIIQTASSRFAKGKVVVDTCFSTLSSITVVNPTKNGWGGRITVTYNGKEQIIHCNGCTGSKLVKNLAVDGNSDGTDLGSTHCLNGKSCIIFIEGALDNTGKDCWNRCNQRQGPCSWCGFKGFCCTRKSGWTDTTNGCDGTFGGSKQHECALSSTTVCPSNCETCQAGPCKLYCSPYNWCGGKISHGGNGSTDCTRCPREYKCYHWSDRDKYQMQLGGWSYAKEKKTCESYRNFIYSQGNEAKAPGCGGCWCCQPK